MIVDVPVALAMTFDVQTVEEVEVEVVGHQQLLLHDLRHYGLDEKNVAAAQSPLHPRSKGERTRRFPSLRVRRRPVTGTRTSYCYRSFMAWMEMASCFNVCTHEWSRGTSLLLFKSA